ncbi:hypothetical protein T12_11520 [Trichinella patagoniensis]|uniref:Uncharacterized protein n=1 Tax=Trichinella patagoniensis TaxID=990121 RepID=A0A0V1A1Z1_9BILA|nr:hypothetical protein T12_11520 [Trichinella patagoniensis]
MPSGRGQQMCRTGCLSLKSNTDRSKTILFVEAPFSLNFLCFSLFTKTKLQAKIIINLIYPFRFNNVLSATNNQSRIMLPPQSYMNELFSRFKSVFEDWCKIFLSPLSSSHCGIISDEHP